MDNDRQHWYTWDGDPRHDSTPKEAKDSNLLPSVTSVMRMYPNPGLDRWIIRETILAAATQPAGYDDKAMIAAIDAERKRKAEESAAWGTVAHGVLESLAEGKKVEVPSQWSPFLEAWSAWFDGFVSDVISTERILVNREGWAGTCDLVFIDKDGELAMLDYKTRDTQKGKRGGPLKPSFYDTQAIQLGAYNDCLESIIRHYSVILSRTIPTHITTKLWDEGEIATGLRRFKCCFELWKEYHQYDPAVRVRL